MAAVPPPTTPIHHYRQPPGLGTQQQQKKKKQEERVNQIQNEHLKKERNNRFSVYCSIFCLNQTNILLLFFQMQDPYSNPLWCIGKGYFRFRQTYQEASRRARERCNGQNRSPITGRRGGNGMRGGNAGTPGKVNALCIFLKKLK